MVRTSKKFKQGKDKRVEERLDSIKNIKEYHNNAGDISNISRFFRELKPKRGGKHGRIQGKMRAK